jgi:hypothetical protein
VSMTATAVLHSLARRGRSTTAGAPHVSRCAVISIRLAEPGEAAALAELAQLAERPAPTGRTLVAEVDGKLRAAWPLDSGAPLIDPFEPSFEVQQLLSLRATQMRADAA